MRPNFPVVWEQEQFRNTLAERGKNPFSEVGRILSAIAESAQEPSHAPHELFLGQVFEVILERVWYEAPADPDMGLARVMDPCISERAIHHLIEVLIMRELNVAADIPSEAFLIHKGSRQAPGVGVLFEHEEVLVAEFVQAIGCA
jgi:hypothetical protein